MQKRWGVTVKKIFEQRRPSPFGNITPFRSSVPIFPLPIQELRDVFICYPCFPGQTPRRKIQGFPGVNALPHHRSYPHGNLEVSLRPLHHILQDLGRDEDQEVLLHKGLPFKLEEPAENGDSGEEGDSPIACALINVINPRDDDDVVVPD